MEKSHKLALLSLASCFAVAATLCTSSAKLCSNIEASAETLTAQNVQYSLPQLSFTAVDENMFAFIPQADYAFTMDFSTRVFTLYYVDDYVQESSPVLADSFTFNYSFSSQSRAHLWYIYAEDMSIDSHVVEYELTVLKAPKNNVLYSYSLDIYLNDLEELTYNYSFYDIDMSEVCSIDFYIEIPYASYVVLNNGFVLQERNGIHYDLLFGSLPVAPYLGAYNSGFNVGYADGRQDGYIDGYADGINNATDEEGLSWTKLFTSMIDVPINAIRSLFNFEILGYNISAFLFSILTIAVVLTVVNLIL